MVLIRLCWLWLSSSEDQSMDALRNRHKRWYDSILGWILIIIQSIVQVVMMYIIYRTHVWTLQRPLIYVPLDKKPARPNCDMLVIRVQLCLGDSNSVIACNRRSIAYTAFILTLLKTCFYMQCSKACSRCKTWRNTAKLFTKQWLCLPHFVPLRFRHYPTHWLIIKFLQRHRAGSQRMWPISPHCALDTYEIL